MKLVIPKQHILIFGRFVHTLAKLRDEMSFHCSTDKLTIKCVNSTQTCLAIFSLDKSFFSAFEIEVYEIKLRLHSKSMLYVFKNLYNIEKCCDKIVFSYDTTVINVEDCLRIVFLKTEGVETVFDVNCLSDESDINPSLQFNTEEELHQTLFNSFSASSKLFNEVIQSFFSADEQIVLEACPSVIRLKSYVTNAISLNELTNRKASSGKEGCTQMVISQQELLSYKVHYLEESTRAQQSQSIAPNNSNANAGADATKVISDEDVLSEIVFNLKHFKLVLSLLQILNTELIVNFAYAGLPLRVLTFQTGLFKGEFWISTLNNFNCNKTNPTTHQNHTTTNGNGTNNNNTINGNINTKSLRDLPDEFPKDDDLDDDLLCSIPLDENAGDVAEENPLNQSAVPGNSNTSYQSIEEKTILPEISIIKADNRVQEFTRDADQPATSKLSQREGVVNYPQVAVLSQGQANKDSESVHRKRASKKSCAVNFESMSTQESNVTMSKVTKMITSNSGKSRPPDVQVIDLESSEQLRRPEPSVNEDEDMAADYRPESSPFFLIFGPPTPSLSDAETQGEAELNFDATVLVEESDVE